MTARISLNREKTRGHRPRLQLRNCEQAFFFPVPNPTKLDLLIAGLEKRLCSTRRAPAASSVEDDLRGLRQFVGAFFEVCHRNMNRAGDGATVFNLAWFTHVHDDKILLRIQL